MEFKILSFILISFFYVVFFSKQIKMRKKGLQANRLGKGDKPKRTIYIEIALFAATNLTAVIQYASIFFYKYLEPFPFPVPIRIAGLFILALGVLFFTIAIVTMRDNWRAGVDKTQKTSMVTSGVYKLSRNPAFTGFYLLYIGTALALPSFAMALAAAVASSLIHLQVLEEEKFLSLTFGEEYIAYKQRTPRYFLFL